MPSTYLTRTPSSSGNRKTWTWSSWCKFSQNATIDTLLSVGADSNNRTKIIRNNVQNGDIRFLYSVGGVQYDLVTSALYRDVSAWYHIVVAVDTTQSTSSNRVKIYINGEQISVFDTANYLPQNTDTDINTTNAHYIGRYSYSASNYMDGSMSHIHFIDGTAYDASYFGSQDVLTGEWKINTSPNVQYGNNGFFILKNSNSVTDQSGNGNNFTVAGGTLTKTEDNPSNVFATWNALNSNVTTLSNGNTTVTGTATDNGVTSTLGFSKGKWYWECKYSTVASGVPVMGILAEKSTHPISSNRTTTSGSGFWGIFNITSGNIGIQENGAHSSGYIDSLYTNGDIAMFAVDADANKIWYGKNGTWFASGNPSNGTNASSDNLTADTTWFCYLEARNGSDVPQMNWGNGFFGTQEITTNTGTGFQDADGKGRFFYNPPTNFRCLSTKGLNQ